MVLAKWLKLVGDRFPRMSALYRSVRDQMDLMGKPETTPWGFKLAGNTDMVKGTFEPCETELMRTLLPDVDILINVGANVGYYCCHALSMGKQVIAFEPIHRNLHYLCKNIKANGWSDAEIYPLALSNQVSIMEMYGGKTGASVIKGWAGAAENYVSLVPSSTMDTVLGNRLRGKRILVIVDIEGSERWMLEGASMMLASDPKPIWIVEITSEEHQPSGVERNPFFKETFQLFFQNGYQAACADRDMHPVTEKDVDLMSGGMLKPVTHNFLFREAKKDVRQQFVLK